MGLPGPATATVPAGQQSDGSTLPQPVVYLDPLPEHGAKYRKWGTL